MAMLVFRFLETLKSIDESIKRLLELVGQQRNDAVEDAKREKKRFYITTAIAVGAIIVAIIVWVFPRA